MPGAFSRKLEMYGALPDEDRALIESVTSRSQAFEADTDISREGDAPGDVYLVTSGFAYRYKILNSGSRQIIAFLLPGDTSDLHAAYSKAIDHTLAALSDVQVVRLTREAIVALLDRPAVSRALLLAELGDKAILREWLANLGQRPAEQRLAHLFCELHLRMTAIGLAREGEIEFPITQAQLGDTTGLSTVHVNRSLQSLRTRGLITLKGRRLVIQNVLELRRLSGFSANYLPFCDASAAAKASRAGVC